MDLVPVRLRDCACPGTPHPEGDIAYLRPFLDFAGGAEAAVAFDEALKTASWDAEGFLTGIPRLYECTGPVYLRRGVTEWNLVDDTGPVPCTPEAVMALPYQDAWNIADRGDDLYRQQVTAPLVQRTRDSSNGTPTAGSTSATRSKSPRPRSRSGRSSLPNSASSPTDTTT
jgi:hypothetical protein